MKRVLRFAAVFVCVLTFGTAVVVAQSEGEKMWDDALELYELALDSQQEARYEDAIGLFEEALVIVRTLDERYAEGVILESLGICYYSLSDYHKASDCFQQSLAIKRQRDDRAGEAANLLNLGICYDRLSSCERAINFYEHALLIFRELEDLLNEAKALTGLGICYKSFSLFHLAIEFHEQSLAISRELEDKAGEAMSLNNIGTCHQSLSNYHLAIDYHERSLAIKRVLEDRAGEANSLNNLGNCYHDLSNCPLAINYYEQALTIYRELGDRDGESACLNNISNCYDLPSGLDQDNKQETWDDAVALIEQALVAKTLKRFQDVIDLCERALAIARELELHTKEGAILGLLGFGHLDLYDYDQAIAYFKRSLEICIEIGDLAGEAAGLTNLAVCYASLFAYERAMDYSDEALAIYRELEDRGGEASCLTNLGLCHHYLSNHHLAIDYHDQALLIFRDIGDRAGEASCLTNLGLCYHSLSDYLLAIDYHERSLAIEREIHRRPGEAMSLGDLGLCYESLLSYEEAINYHSQSLVLSVELGMQGTEFLANWGLGRSYRGLEDYETALPQYESAIAIVESIRGTVRDEDLRQSYFGSLRTLYEEYLELLLELGRDEETILVAERLRARTFLDALYQSGLTPEQLQLNEAGIDRTSGTVLPVMDFEALKLAVEEAQSSLLTNEAVLEYMVGDDGIYLWVLTSERILGPELIPYEREQLLRDVVTLRRAVEPRTEVTNGQPAIIFSDPSEPLGLFYEVLIQPVLSQLADEVDTLIVIPSGPLWYVPFSALVMTDRPQVEFGSPGMSGAEQYRPRYLIDEYTLAFLPSLASLPMLMEERAPSTAMYLALANPTLSESQQEEVSSRYQFPVLETTCLAFAECISSRSLSVQEQVVHVQGEALESRAHTEAAGHEVLVYACHGLFNPGMPLDSRLLLAPSLVEEDETPSGYLRADGNYYASEVILTDHTGVDLVILAACETLLPALTNMQGALGMTMGPESDEDLNEEQLELIVAGDEVVGLSRAFLSSGAQSVLGTLWQANPTAINELLGAMCAAHSAGDGSWANALREAQRAILAESLSTFTLTYETGLAGAHPWFWGAFQLIGGWR